MNRFTTLSLFSTVAMMADDGTSATPPATTLSPVQIDADNAVGQAAQTATDAIDGKDAATISADAAAFLEDLKELGYDEIKNLLEEFLSMKAEGSVSSFKSFFTHIGTQIGGLISKL